MSYSTDADLLDYLPETELIQRTDRSRAGSIDWAIIEKARSLATAEINSYLAAFALPLAAVPPVLVQIEMDILRRNLYTGQIVEHVEARYNSAVKYLGQVAAGRIKLGNESDGTAPGVQASSVMLTEDAALFGRDSFAAW